MRLFGSSHTTKPLPTHDCLSDLANFTHTGFDQWSCKCGYGAVDMQVIIELLRQHAVARDAHANLTRDVVTPEQSEAWHRARIGNVADDAYRQGMQKQRDLDVARRARDSGAV